MIPFVARSGALAAAVAVLVHLQPASATVVRYLTLEEHLELSELVVRARVGSASTFMGETGLPFTDTELEILEVLAGKRPATEILRVRQLRGEAKGLYRAVPGDAELLPGEEVILFLHGLEGEIAYLTALGQSKYTVERPMGAGDEGGALVIRDLSLSAFYRGGGSPSLSPGFVEAPVDLKLFRETVRELVEAGR